MSSITVRRHAVASALLVVMALPALVHAASTPLKIVSESGVYQEMTGAATTSQGVIALSGDSEDVPNRTLFKFNIAGLPTGATITGATLTLTIGTNTHPTILPELHRSPGTWNAASPVGTDFEQIVDLTPPYSSGGTGTFIGDLPASGVLASSAELLALVKDWYNYVKVPGVQLNELENRGFYMKLPDANEFSSTSKTFTAMTPNDSLSTVPILEVFYTTGIPEPVSLGWVGIVIAAVATHRRRSQFS